MNEETFLEKYPEFKGEIWDNEHSPHIDCKDVKEILDKHFVSRKHLAIDNIKYGEFQGLLKYFIAKQKVKDILEREHEGYDSIPKWVRKLIINKLGLE